MGLKIEIKTTIEAVVRSWDTCDTCSKMCVKYVPHLKKEPLFRSRQLLLFWNTSQGLPGVQIFMWNIPSFKYLQVIKKQQQQKRSTSSPPPQKGKESNTCSQAYHGLWVTSLSKICVSVIANLWCKLSYSPSLNQTVVIYFRYWRKAKGWKIFRSIGRFHIQDTFLLAELDFNYDISAMNHHKSGHYSQTTECMIPAALTSRANFTTFFPCHEGKSMSFLHYIIFFIPTLYNPLSLITSRILLWILLYIFPLNFLFLL